jgi:hypothetical protein
MHRSPGHAFRGTSGDKLRQSHPFAPATPALPAIKIAWAGRFAGKFSMTRAFETRLIPPEPFRRLNHASELSAKSNNYRGQAGLRASIAFESDPAGTQ